MTVLHWPLQLFLLSLPSTVLSTPFNGGIAQHDGIACGFVSPRVKSMDCKIRSQDATSNVANSFGANQLIPSYHNYGTTSPSSLHMGIRSFIRNKVGGKGGGGEEDPEDVKEALKAIKADLEAVEKMDQREKIANAKKTLPKSTLDTLANLTPSKSPATAANTKPPRRMPIPSPLENLKNSAKKEDARLARPYSETARDRVQRMKSGSMTDDEKASFLNTALSPRGGPPKGKPIRQPIPSVPGESKSGGNKGGSRRDALWNVMKTAAPSRSSDKNMDILKNPITQGSEKNLSDSAKRDYLDMVTNPNRFSSYAAMGGSRTSSVNTDDEEDSEPPAPVDNEKTQNLQIISGMGKDNNEDENTLAARLEEAAIQKEKLDTAAKLQRDREREIAKQRQAERDRLLGEQRLKTEQTTFDQKRREQERQHRAMERAQEEEEKKMANMLAAQDAYWAQQLGKEEEKKNTMRTKEEIEEMEYMKIKEEQIARLQKERDEEIKRLREEERAREPPHESQILQEAAEGALHEREKNAGITEAASARVTRTVPQDTSNKDVSVSSFVQEQEEKKAAIDKLVKEQKARLSTLSSPLPSPNDPQAPPAVAPQVPRVPPKPKPIIPRVTPKPVPPSSPPMPNLSLSQLTMNKKSPTPTPPTTYVPPPAQPAAGGGNDAPRLSLAQMTMLKKPDGGAPAAGGVSANRKQPPPPSQPVAPAQRKITDGPIRQRVVRQQVPLPDPVGDDDDEDDDFFQYSRDGSNMNVSLKDIMSSSDDGGENRTKRKITPPKSDNEKDKSKMWGIDIDLFN